jgi:hypothetical protein
MKSWCTHPLTKKLFAKSFGVKADAAGIAFRHPTSQSGTEAFQYLTGSLIPVPEWLQQSAYFSFLYRTDRLPDSTGFRHLHKM